jgi:PadR family transcriptional regulator PadR
MRESERGLFPGALEMMVLQTLRQGPLHGYALAQTIKKHSGLSARNRKVRIYKITPAGRKQLERETSSFEQMLDGIARVMKPVRS